MFIPLWSLFQVFIFLPLTSTFYFDVALLCSLHLVSYLSVLLSNDSPATYSPLLIPEPYFLSPLCFSFLFRLPTCLTLCCFFLRPSTPLPVTQYFQFTLLLSNLPLHSSRAPLHYLPPIVLRLLSSSCCRLVWRMDSRILFLHPLNSSYTVCSHCWMGVILTFGCFWVVPFLFVPCMAEHLCVHSY